MKQKKLEEKDSKVKKKGGETRKKRQFKSRSMQSIITTIKMINDQIELGF